VLAVRSERADVLYASISIIGYTADLDDSVRIAGVYQRTLVAAAFEKGSEVAPHVQAAIQSLMDDGAYEEILAKWGLDEN
ncbi:hypothetical protein, partial [Bacillus sp. SIMBA_005]|uniref:hypothetical protein n=1 Tax=Bacillus sp. SIMBA_005 TaxID=3085754 RepID=UPI00397C78E8